MKRKRRRKPRKYEGNVAEFFHNFEHDPKGLNHCCSTGNHPYEVRHLDGKHVITSRVARGHGRARKPQWFKFARRLGDGWDLASGVKIDRTV